MSVTLWAELGGCLLVPLADCDWVLRAACGCVVGLTVAALPGGVLCASEDQAWPALYEGEEAITAAKQRGEHLELMTSEHVRAEVLPSFGVPCPHGKNSSEERSNHGTGNRG